MIPCLKKLSSVIVVRIEGAKQRMSTIIHMREERVMEELRYHIEGRMVKVRMCLVRRT